MDDDDGIFGSTFFEGDIIEDTYTKKEVVSYGPNELKQYMKVNKPNNPRAQVGFAGLENGKAICYLNSLLQTLYMTPDFRSNLYSLTPEQLGITQNNPAPAPLSPEEIEQMHKDDRSKQFEKKRRNNKCYCYTKTRSKINGTKKG